MRRFRPAFPSAPLHLVLGAVFVLGGCRTGGLDTGEIIATGPAGIRMHLSTEPGSFFGELLEVRPEGLVILIEEGSEPAGVEGPVVLVARDMVSGDVRAGTDRPTGDENGRTVDLDSTRDREWLRGLSRFPYGMGGEVERRLLILHDQEEIVVLRPEGRGAAPDGEGRIRSFVAEVERSIRPYRNRETAIQRGYRRVGPDFPGMGEHWVNPGLVLAGGVVPEAPQILTYLAVDGRSRLTGAAFTMPLGPGEEPPVEPVGKEVWHDHEGSIDEESVILESPHTMHAGGDGPRLAMFHTWIWPENPDGPLAQNNWALPWVRLGLTAPDRPDPAVARGLSLAGEGEEYYRTLLTRAARLGMDGGEGKETGDVAVIEAAVRRASRRVLDVVDPVTSGTGLDPRQTSRIRAAWAALWSEIRDGVAPEVWERLRPAFQDWGAVRESSSDR